MLDKDGSSRYVLGSAIVGSNISYDNALYSGAYVNIAE